MANSDTQTTPATPARDDAGQHRPAMTSLSEELRALVDAADGKPMSVGQILDRLKDRGHAMFIVIVMAPFLLLPTTFGLSAPMGFAVAIIGFCIMIGRTPWLPRFIQRKEFPYESLVKLMGPMTRLSRFVEKISKPRLGVFLWPGFINLVGLWLIVWGLLMALPGPNNIFAFMLTLFAFGLVMRDGALILLGHVLTLIAPVLAYIFWDEIWGFISSTWEKVQGLFSLIT